MNLLSYLTNYAVCAPQVVIIIPVAEAGRLTDDNLQAVSGSLLMEAFWFEEQHREASYLVFVPPNQESGGINIEMKDIETAEYLGHGGIFKLLIKGVPNYVQFIPLIPHPVFSVGKAH